MADRPEGETDRQRPKPDAKEALPTPGKPQQGGLDYSASPAPYHIRGEEEEMATRELHPWIGRLMDNEQLALAVSTRWLVQHQGDRILTRDHTCFPPVPLHFSWYVRQTAFPVLFFLCSLRKKAQLLAYTNARWHLVAFAP